MSTFIKIEVQRDRLSPELTQQLVSVCPVDIFELQGGRLAINAEQEDECTLCELCLDVVPPEVLVIRKTYKNECLFSRGGQK
jgi:ferredoxin-like protein FixX